MRITIIYYLRKSRVKQDGQMPIYVRITVKSKRTDLTTGIFIHPKDCSQTRQRVKDKSRNAYPINERLNKLRTEIQDLYNQLRSSGEEPSLAI